MNRTQGVSLVTLMPTGWRRLYRHVSLKWVIGQRSVYNAARRLTGGQRRGSAPPVYLEALNFIHFGRWIILNRHPWRSWRSHGLPHFDGQPPETLKRSIMLFTSNFDFDWRPYVDTFTETAMDDLGVFWDSMPGWSYPTKVGYRKFFKFVDEHAIEHDHYYVAFPGFATAHIKSALFVDRAVRSFSIETAGYTDPTAWNHAFKRLVARLQRDLGSIPPPLDAVNPPAFSPGGNGHLGLTILAPVGLDRFEAVRQTIRDLPPGIDSPFALLPGTHFGRLVMIHKIREHQGYLDLKSGYILLSVDVDAPSGGQDAWLRKLFQVWSSYGPDGSRNLIDEIWGSCWGFDPSKGEDGFVSYMTKVSYTATIPFNDYPHASLWDIHRAITTHGWFTGMVFDLPTTAPSRRQAFLAGVAENLPVDPPTTARLPDLSNVQANILHGSSRWEHARYVFFRIEDSVGAAAFIDGLRSSSIMGDAASQRHTKARANINVAFTHSGLGIMDATIGDTERFQGRHTLRSFRESADAQSDLRSAFEGGMYSAEINDVWPVREGRRHTWPQNRSDATAWWSDDVEEPWQPTASWPHILVWISATTRGVRQDVYEEVEAMVPPAGVIEVGRQDADLFDGFKEHFGFVDGISQPAIKGIRPGNPGDGKLGARGWEGLEVGEFILGYADESRHPADEPLPNELARDGTFLVYRKLRQDVEAFHDAASAMPGDDTEIQEKIMGRKRDGNPLVTPPGAPAVPPNNSALRNDFTYSGDRRGHRCPLGSHVRRANPRDDLHFEGRRVNGHRIIRRGMPYGEPYEKDPQGERGLIFIAFNARIEDQFEFIQKQWLNRGTTFRIGDDADPIAGVGTDIRIVINGDTPVLHKVDRPFTQFLGGDYFFVPSIRALRQIATLGRAASE